MIKTELYFGLSIKGEVLTKVSEQSFNEFAADVIMPRFPDGFTILSGTGIWRGGFESCKVLIVVHRGIASSNNCINQIRDLFCRLFNQESVMRVDSEVEVSF